MSRRIATSPTSTAKARRMLAAATVRMETVHTVAAEIAGEADVLEAADVAAADVAGATAGAAGAGAAGAAADVADATAEAAVADATVAAADQAADGTSIRRIHRRTQIKKGRNARCGLFR